MKWLRLSIVLLLIFVCLLQPFPVAAESDITISHDKIVSDFPNKLTFQLSLSSNAKIQNIKLLYRTNGATCQTAVAQQVIDFTPGNSLDVQWVWDFTLSGVLPPGAVIYWQWQITGATGNIQLTDEQSYLVNDPRHTWNLLTSGQLNLQWYEGSRSFGQSLLGIAVQSLDRLVSDAGVRPSGQIWITIYPTADELLEVDIHTSEWAGGISYPEYNSTIMAISTKELDWAASVIPHELAHLVTESVVFNCRGMWLPTWLSEGLAVYAEGQVTQYYLDMVTSALEKETLPPLRSLESGFSSVSEEANLSYGQSGMIVTYMIGKYGAGKMADLLVAIQSGQMIDKALLAVYGKDTDGLDAAWRISLGYVAEPTLAPTSSSHTAVPTMALWTSAVRPGSTPSSLPSLTPTTIIMTDTPEPLPSVTLPQPSTSPLTNDPGHGSGISSATVVEVIIAAVVLVVIAVIGLIIVLKRRSFVS